jgi:hypothetical protein
MPLPLFRLHGTVIGQGAIMENRDARVQGRDKESARPCPNGELDQNRGPETQQGEHQGGRQTVGGYEYKGGRQAQGGVPNPDDPNDHESAGSFRGTASLPGADIGDGEQGQGVGQNPGRHPDSQSREPE